MPRTLQEIVDHDEELADRFEAYEPSELDHIPLDVEAERRLTRAVRLRAAAEREIAENVELGRRHGMTWRRIGYVLGTSAQAAQKRYGAATPT